jgi:hypothetical protein
LPALSVPPSPLTPSQRRLLWIAAVLVAATRLFAMASSPWDWDEVQFMAGVHEYDVGKHHPHPAGFPLYILAAKIVQLAGLSDFRSLQVVGFVAACSLFPILFFVARELGFTFRTSLVAATLFVFLPNIWYFGGTIFSDITGTAVTLAAVLMLLRGCRDGRAFLIGCALVGAALAVRPHNGFILLPPLLFATWSRRREFGRIAAGAGITASIAIASYLGAALASESVAVYIDRLVFFQKWVHDVDSIANPGRTPLRQLALDFFVWPMGAGRLSMIVAGLAAVAVVIGAVRRHRGVLVTLATFAPYMIFGWLMLDPLGFRRYSTAYVAVYALLAAYALEVLAARVPRAAVAAQGLAAALIIVRYVWWAYPAIAEVRSTIAPTHAASTLVRQLVPPGGRVWVDDSMPPWASYYLADREVVMVRNPADLPLRATPRDYFLTEGVVGTKEGRVFARPRGRVAEIHPQRHFEASVAPLTAVWRFGEGWSDPEGHLAQHWRWMGGRGVVLVPPAPGPARLVLELGPPSETRPEVEVRFNGVLLERFALTGRVRKEWPVTGGTGWTPLEIRVNTTVSPLVTGTGGDPRALGLQLFSHELEVGR